MHGGNLLAAMEKYGRKSFIDLSANINPFGPPEGVWDAIQKALPKIVHYPDPESRRLRRVLSQKYAMPEDSILLGNGAGELLFAILQALRPKKVLTPVPAFSEYERAAWACGAEVRTLEIGVSGWVALGNDPGQEKRQRNPLKKVNDRQTEFLELWKETLQDCDLVFLNSPHNPTGSLLMQSEFECILKAAQEHGTYVVMDESFVDFLEDEVRWSAREYLRDYPNLIVLYSMTKFYSIPGLRLGVVFASSELLNQVKKQRDPWAVNILAEEAGLAALADSEYPERVRGRLKKSREFFYTAFAKAHFSQFILKQSSVNFALIQILKGQSQNIVEHLGKQGILVRDCGNFQGLHGEFIRVAIKDIPSMQALINGLGRSEVDE